MMRSVFLRRLLFALLAAFLLAAIFMVAGYMFWSRDIYADITLSEMLAKADVARRLLYEYADGNMTRGAFERSSLALVRATNSAVLIIAADGTEYFYNSGAVALTLEQIHGGADAQIEAVLSGDTLTSDRIRISDEGDIMLAGLPMEEKGAVVGGVFVVKSGEEVTIITGRMSASLFWIMLIVIPVIMLLASFRIRSITGPLHRISEAAVRMANGDFDVRVNEAEGGEVGILARSLNELCANLSQSIYELRSEKSQLNEILQGLSDGVVAIDGVGMLTHYNSAIMKMFGAVNAAKREDLISDGNIWRVFAEVFETGKAQTITYPMVGERTLWISISPVAADGGERTGVVGLFKDMTEMERLEAMRREYVSNVSHELRTPLTAVRGLLEPLADGMVRDEADRERYYRVMLHEVERLSRLISDMLTISRLQSGSDYMEPVRVSLGEIINDVAAGYSGTAAQKGIDLVVDVPECLPDAMTDVDRIEQVIVILLDNAMRYTPEGGAVTIRVSDGEKLIVSVIDTGCGIAERDTEHIFERFYKVDKSRGEGGTGLGLYIAKSVMNRLGEEITVESKLGVGSRFRFTVKKYVRNAIALGPASIDEYNHTVIRQSAGSAQRDGGESDADIVDASYEVIPLERTETIGGKRREREERESFRRRDREPHDG